mmetsp:Transcript_90956/g.257536  ORF Transcript_90956/g.257536 Transcript_90956/m.257536 type:complete len:207 (-) Transcript_90956:1065-1685(-)
MISCVASSLRRWSGQLVRAIFSRPRSSRVARLCIVSCRSTKVMPRILVWKHASVTPCQPATRREPGQMACSGLFSQSRLPARSTRQKTVPPRIGCSTVRSSARAARKGATSATRPSKPTSTWTSHCTGITAAAWNCAKRAMGAAGPARPLMSRGACDSFTARWQHGMQRPLISQRTSRPQSVQPRPSQSRTGKLLTFESTVPSRSL